MKTINIEQNGNDWLVWRSSGLGASDAPAILGISPWTTPLELWKEKRTALVGNKARERTNKHRVPRETPAMARGKRLEPEARELLEALTGIQAQALCAVHDDLEWLKASLDGYDPALDLILEIKCPNSGAHSKALSGSIPEYYWPQVVHQALVVGGSGKVLYVSYSPDREFEGHERLAMVEAVVSLPERAIYQAAATEFWHSVLAGSPPQD